MASCKGRINSFETFGSVDGPGVRFVVFMQGCNMRCKYCHNPEMWSYEPVIEMTADEVIEKALRYASYWGREMKNGGITVSGGEPMLQMDFLIELFASAKKNRIHTVLDTSGQPFEMNDTYLKKFNELMKNTDLFMMDMKMYDDVGHKNLTGHGNHNIKSMMRYLSDNKKEMWVRHVLVPELTDGEKDLRDIADFISSLDTVSKVEILPYHALGVPKWDKLGIKYELKDARAPSEDEIERASKLIGTF